MKRSNGVLLPVSSLPSRYGIGCFSNEAYEFIDLLKRAGQSYWQILPLGPTGYGDSPYQSFSTFAGNPYFIDLEQLILQGLLTGEECAKCDWGDEEEEVDYGKIYQSRFQLLRKAFERSRGSVDKAFLEFCRKEEDWLSDYALFMAVKDSFGGKSLSEWEGGIRFRTLDALEAYRKKLEQEIDFYRFVQYVFYRQWNALKQYANENGIRIIGDIPIYVAYDSADTWANPQLFELDASYRPLFVAGCPPDGFSENGQLWGNPIYRWEIHEKDGYSWWLRRIAHCFRLYDMVRIDHFRGFDSFYEIPYGDSDAKRGRWIKGPGILLFEKIKEELGEVNIIAEDLGFLTDDVKRLLSDTGYPGMKVLQFAFDSREESDYLPHHYGRNCVVYTGTHDNDTIAGWYASLSEEDRLYSMYYLNNWGSKPEKIPWDFICLAMRSAADICMIPFQDFLGLGSRARLNTPSTLGHNWTYRMKEGAFTEELADKINLLTNLFGRAWRE